MQNNRYNINVSVNNQPLNTDNIRNNPIKTHDHSPYSKTEKKEKNRQYNKKKKQTKDDTNSSFELQSRAHRRTSAVVIPIESQENPNENVESNTVNDLDRHLSNISKSKDYFLRNKPRDNTGPYYYTFMGWLLLIIATGQAIILNIYLAKYASHWWVFFVIWDVFNIFAFIYRGIRQLFKEHERTRTLGRRLCKIGPNILWITYSLNVALKLVVLFLRAAYTFSEKELFGPNTLTFVMTATVAANLVGDHILTGGWPRFSRFSLYTAFHRTFSIANLMDAVDLISIFLRKPDHMDDESYQDLWKCKFHLNSSDHQAENSSENIFEEIVSYFQSIHIGCFSLPLEILLLVFFVLALVIASGNFGLRATFSRGSTSSSVPRKIRQDSSTTIGPLYDRGLGEASVLKAHFKHLIWHQILVNIPFLVLRIILWFSYGYDLSALVGKNICVLIVVIIYMWGIIMGKDDPIECKMCMRTFGDIIEYRDHQKVHGQDLPLMSDDGGSYGRFVHGQNKEIQCRKCCDNFTLNEFIRHPHYEYGGKTRLEQWTAKFCCRNKQTSSH